jgi:predicted metalloprotease with PDZ domain
MDELFQQSRVADDPEVRERCLLVLRELVEDEYSKDGEGYIGIRMRDEELALPEDAKSRGVIRVIEVVRGSAAAKAGLQLNDLILSFDNLVWDEKLISMPFMDKIRQLKPNSKITLNVMRNGKPMDLPVTLGRRPPMIDNSPFGERTEDPAAVEQAAKDNYFRHWLERRNAGK